MDYWLSVLLNIRLYLWNFKWILLKNTLSKTRNHVKNSREAVTLILRLNDRMATFIKKNTAFSANKNKIRHIYITSILATGRYNGHLPNSSLNKNTWVSVTKWLTIREDVGVTWSSVTDWRINRNSDWRTIHKFHYQLRFWHYDQAIHFLNCIFYSSIMSIHSYILSGMISNATNGQNLRNEQLPCLVTCILTDSPSTDPFLYNKSSFYCR
jgi:hypothetical protein